MYTLPGYENFQNFIVDYNQTTSLTIGKGNNCDIIVKNDMFGDNQLSIEFKKENNLVLVKNLFENNKLYVNDILCNESYLTNGDVIFINGIYIYFLGPLLLVSNNNNDLMYNSSKLNLRMMNENPISDYSGAVDKEVVFLIKQNIFKDLQDLKGK